jgi:hypothetical protein
MERYTVRRGEGAGCEGAVRGCEGPKVPADPHYVLSHCRTGPSHHRTGPSHARTLAPSDRMFSLSLFRLQPPGDPFDLMADSQLARPHDLRR